MMFQSGYVLVVKDDNGKVLRETGSSHDKQVFLPYNSEYSLLLKNKNHYSVVAEVTIDGTDVLGGRRIVIDPDSDFELERFMVDGNLSRGRRFKFVEPGHPDVQDPHSPDLGDIRVRFYRVEEPKYYTPVHKPVKWQIPKKKGKWDPVDPWAEKSLQSRGGENFSCSATPDCLMRSGDNVGATVEGSYSGQKFREVNIDNISSHYTEIRLRILAPKNSESSVTAVDTRYVFCSECGAKNPRTANFCSNCGAKLLKPERY